jgi:hypothetical protein
LMVPRVVKEPSPSINSFRTPPARPRAEIVYSLSKCNTCARQKKLPPRGMVSAPSCELTCTPATCSAWASGHFSAQTARRDSSARCRVRPTGNRDAGKFAAGATQLPTGCQPESLAKPARRRSHRHPSRSCSRAASSTAVLARPRHSDRLSRSLASFDALQSCDRRLALRYAISVGFTPRLERLSRRGRGRTRAAVRRRPRPVSAESDDRHGRA